MTENENKSGQPTEKNVKTEAKSSEEITLPIFASAEDILRASRIVMDKGGSVRFNEISKMFGEKASDKNLLSNSLGAATVFGILEPHKGRAPYKLSSFGKSLLTAPNEEQTKKMLLPRFLEYVGYRNILIGMRNREDRAMKKQSITDMWINIVGGKVGTRKRYTQTFVSVGQYCGAIEVTGQTCTLRRDVESILSSILKGESKLEGSEQISTQLTTTSDKISDKQVWQIPIEISKCPVCNKTDLIVNERYLDKIPTKGGTLLILERTIKCKGCSNKFVRTIKELVPSPE
jgi:uncharacterized protein with PIN domain